MQRRIPAVLMRGGTSKGLFILANQLPADPSVRDRVILAAYGSPDPNGRQIDGVGGAVSTTSKVAIISASTSPEYDVVYNFGQVSIDRPIVDFKSNCGNISAAVGPFAVDAGLVPASEPITHVRIHQLNTNKLIVAEVPVRNGCFEERGDYSISGVPGTGARITLRFIEPGGALTGRLLPTGRPQDSFEVPGMGSVAVTIIDAANPVVLVRAEAIGLNGTEIGRFDQDAGLRAVIETIRCQAAVRIGLAATEQEATQRSQAVPKIGFAAAPRPYNATGGQAISDDDIDLVARMMSMGTLHRSFPVSGAIATVGATMIPGTVVYDLLPDRARASKLLRIGHPGGVIEVGAVLDMTGDTPYYREAILGRTARRLMEGYVLVPDFYFAKVPG